MKICKNCGQKLDGSSRFCTVCRGTSFRTSGGGISALRIIASVLVSVTVWAMMIAVCGIVSVSFMFTPERIAGIVASSVTVSSSDAVGVPGEGLTDAPASAFAGTAAVSVSYTGSDSAYVQALTGSSGTVSESDVLDRINGFLGDELSAKLNLTPEKVRNIIEKSTFSDFVAEKAASAFKYIANGGEDVTVTTDDVISLLRENEALIEQETGYRLTDDDYTEVAASIDESGVLDDFSVSGIVDENGGPEATAALKLLLSPVTLIAAAAVFISALVLLVLIGVINWDPKAPLIYGGVTFALSGILWASVGGVMLFAADYAVALLSGRFSAYADLIGSFMHPFGTVCFISGAAVCAAGIVMIILYSVFVSSQHRRMAACRSAALAAAGAAAQ